MITQRRITTDLTLTYLLTYLLTPWSRVLLEKLTGLQLIKKFPAFYGTRNFITVLPSARHLTLSSENSIQSPQPFPTSSRSILILSSHPRHGLPNGLFPSGFPTKTLCTSLRSSIRAACPAHLILLDFITRTILGEEYRELSSSLCNFLHSPVTPSLLGQIFSSKTCPDLTLQDVFLWVFIKNNVFIPHVPVNVVRMWLRITGVVAETKQVFLFGTWEGIY